MGDISGKVRLLKVLEVLERETDEDHYLSLDELEKKLMIEFGPDFSVGKKALLSDIRALKEAGFDILEDEGKFGKKMFSYPHRLFEPYELRMLIDAAMYSHFITKEDARSLIEKLQKQTSSHISKKLQEQIRYLDYTMKADNHQLKYYVDTIYQACSERKKIRFRYGKYNLDKEFVLKKNGEWYEVKPYALVWLYSNYYLIGKYGEEETFRHYRVDRMRNVHMLSRRFKKEPFNVVDYVNKTVRMFSGPEKQVKIQFHDDEDHTFINIVLDRFGKDVHIEKGDDGSFIVTVSVNISQGLVSWILTWGSKVKVLSPLELVENVKRETEKMYRLYHEAEIAGYRIISSHS
ncbi:helix-turn-helix transcriptional regulator [Lihuaxuella thermophila]|uniref:Predicted DNA-binding transcriptional regulator YafY, contains an HTH and WYL domains n=1 Tax=Lihuaxuella thermophila TaxID=1173111 RepID=A0A1H8CEA9_9BACL|nr:WYL domain-containing protein [Lihuaxuella thermophila]SEM93330.1 Predicted DNA-binding transcriptional regulator YafY, contains an HTH and WYL domains [Lihuaxuella thermophila]